MSKAFLFILVSFALSGCISAYQEPSGSGTASLKIEGALPSGTLTMESYADRSCQSPSQMGAIGMVFDRDLQKKIPAGREFVLTGNWMGIRFAANVLCSSTVTFVPEAARDYVATFAVSPDEHSCSLAIGQRTGAGVKPVSFRKNDALCSTFTRLGPKHNGVAMVRVYTATVSTYTARR